MIVNPLKVFFRKRSLIGLRGISGTSGYFGKDKSRYSLNFLIVLSRIQKGNSGCWISSSSCVHGSGEGSGVESSKVWRKDSSFTVEASSWLDRTSTMRDSVEEVFSRTWSRIYFLMEMILYENKPPTEMSRYRADSLLSPTRSVAATRGRE
jgi:hypothetical protein